MPSSNWKRFFSQLARAFPADRLSRAAEDLSVYGQDWSGVLEPKAKAIAFPRSSAEVAKILALCSANGIPVVPSGGRTGLSGGATAARGELVLSLAKMNRISAVDPVAQTVRVEAGAVTEAVHEACLKHGLTWPVDFASKGSSQIGGNLATNAGGVHVIRYGNTRQWVLSLQLATMQGELIECNGELEKNNTGYDLRQLVVGSEGTLGVVTEATLKLVKPPEKTQVLFFGLKDMQAVIRLFGEARRAPFTLHAFECLTRACYERGLEFFGMKAPVPATSGVYVLLEADPSAESWVEGVLERGLVDDGVIAQSPREARDLWKLREGVAESVAAGSMVYQHDVSVPISRLSEFSAWIESHYRRHYPEFQVYVFGHIGDGNLHIFIRKPEKLTKAAFLKTCHASDRALFERIAELKGSVSAEHGIGVLKKPALKYSRSKTEIALLKGIKKAFDPKGLLNPGKLIS